MKHLIAILFSLPALAFGQGYFLLITASNQIPVDLPSSVQVCAMTRFQTDQVAMQYLDSGGFHIPANEQSEGRAALVDLISKTFVMVTGTYAQATNDLAPRIAQSVLEAEQLRMDQQWPLLTDHPATNEVPVGGLNYRISDGTNIYFYVARQGDLLATQLSAHDGAGNEITRTVNLKTGEETTINLRKLTEATKWSDLRDSKTSKTNKLKKVKQP